ncbi:MAG: hypothetical protein ACT4PM_07715 [Gemmatimonadales bacterium]
MGYQHLRAIHAHGELHQHECHGGGSLSIDRFAGTLTITPKAGGATMTEQVEGLHVMRKEADGSWEIAMDVWNMDAPPPAAPPSPRP